MNIFFGTSDGSEGIYVTKFDPKSGSLDKSVGLAARLNKPGFQALHPQKGIVYSTGLNAACGTESVTAFAMNGRELDEMNHVPTECGSATHLTVHPSGKFLATAHYGDSNVALFPIDESGNLQKRSQLIPLTEFSEVNPDRQEAAHPHYATFDPSGNFLLIPDLGADKVHVFRVDIDSASVSEHSFYATKPGAGPRHMKFSNDGRFAFVLNELDLTVDTCTWDAGNGTLTLASSTHSLTVEEQGKELENLGSEIRVHPNEKFLYTANRGNDSISTFSIDKDSGQLTRLQLMPTRAAWPRNFNLDPSGQWLVCAGQDSDNAGVFSVDPEHGVLTYQPRSNINLPAPICVTFIG